MHRLAIELLEQAGDLAAVLGPNPVELEAVGHVQRDLGKVVRNLCRQGLDPGVELLLGELLGELVDAGLPQAVAPAKAGIGCQAVVLPLTHYWLSPLWILFVRGSA